MYVKLRTQRSRPSRLNGVAPKNRIGTSLVRKKWRTSEMFFSRRRDCPEPGAEPGAKAASVPTLTSVGLADTVLAPLVVPDFRATPLVVPDFRPTDLGLVRFAAAVPTLTSVGLAAAVLARLVVLDLGATDLVVRRFAALAVVGLAAAVLARLVVPDFTGTDLVLRRFAAGTAFLAVVFVV